MKRVLKSSSLLAMTAAALGAVAGCQQGWTVERTDPRQPVDFDYRFNDEDARQIFHQMAGDMLTHPWLESHRHAHGDQRPIVYLANVRNNTQDYIATELFTNQLEEAMLNSGRVRVKAERDARQELRDERLDTRYNDPATVKAVAKELNADYALMGSISDVKQRHPSGAIMNYYQARMELINVETAEKVWTKTSEIKKVAQRR